MSARHVLALLLTAACGSGSESLAGANDQVWRPDAAAADAGLRASQPVAADAGPPRPASYARVVDILQRSCSYVRCHDGPLIGGALRLAHDGDYAAVLIGVTACEYERMARVQPGDPEHSWLMVKLTAPFRGPSDAYANYIDFAPEAGWDPERRGCQDRTDEGQPLFGQRMPLTAPNMLPEEELQSIRQWIQEGAPVER